MAVRKAASWRVGECMTRELMAREVVREGPAARAWRAVVIELRGRLLACTRLAIGVPSLSVGWNEKSVSSLFGRNPWTITPLPNELSMLVVIDNAFP